MPGTPPFSHGQLDTTALAALVDDRVKLIGVSHVPTSGGLVNPAEEIGRIARGAGVLFLLDATQSVGQFPRRRERQRLDPFVAEIGSATWDGARGFTWADGARRFESWEKSYVNIVGLGAAVRQALQLGADAIGARTARLGARGCAASSTPCPRYRCTTSVRCGAPYRGRTRPRSQSRSRDRAAGTRYPLVAGRAGSACSAASSSGVPASVAAQRAAPIAGAYLGLFRR
jgi:hypothetical protein